MSSNWLKTIKGMLTGDVHQGNKYCVSEKSPEEVISMTLMSELQYQMKDAEVARFEAEQAAVKKSRKVDYTWLASRPRLTHHDMSPLEKLQLESLTTHVRPDEVSQVLQHFREVVERSPPPEEMPAIMTAVINTVMNARPPPPREDTLTDWLARQTTAVVQRMPTLTTPSRVTPAADVFMSPDDDRAEFGGERHGSSGSRVTTVTGLSDDRADLRQSDVTQCNDVIVWDDLV